MEDQNDILYNGYQIDFIYVGQRLFEIFGFDNLTYAGFIEFWQTAWDIWVILAIIISGLAIVGFIYAYMRYNQMGDLETVQVETQERLYKELYAKNESNTRWDDIQQHITTDNPNDWKLAIIEADVMLEEVLDGAGYAGATIGEKLKSASPASFETIDAAWDAHKVRNQIAHGGADFVLTKRQAGETIAQYRRVFSEFGAL
ncbi:hypothetical protein N9L26_02365 [Candidatus Pacebacteria bacterium]|nr:hypothetical protein [Candidatus Paceibacterota bacterium]